MKFLKELDTHIHTRTNARLFSGHPSRSTWVCQFPTDPPHILINTIPPCPSQTGEGRRWRKISGGKVHFMRGNWCRVSFARCPSCCQPVELILLRPPTDSRGKGHCSPFTDIISIILSGFSTVQAGSRDKLPWDTFEIPRMYLYISFIESNSQRLNKL